METRVADRGTPKAPPADDSSREEGRQGEGQEPKFSGPIWLASIAGWLAGMGGWNAFTKRPIPAGILEQLTPLGEKHYRPDYDLVIYLAALLLAVFMGVVAALGWRRLWREGGEECRRAVERALKSHAWIAWGCSLLALARPGDFRINLVLATLALAALIGLWFRGRRLARALPSADLAPRRRDAPAAQQAAALDASKTSPPLRARGVADRASAARAASGTRPGLLAEGGWKKVAASFAAVALVVLLIYVPNVEELVAGVLINDSGHHWNYYLMGPLLAFRHGKGLGIEAYTQYGVGWPLLFSLVGPNSPVTYERVLESVVVWGCLYFAGLYLFLQSFTGRIAWAYVGLLMALHYQMFCGTIHPLWVYPSSSILRNTWDIPLFWCCLRHAQSGDSRYGAPIGTLAGLGVLFGTDTGIFSTAALLFYLLLATRFRPGGRGTLTARFLTSTALAFFGTTLAGLAWAGRGTLLQREFWLGYWETILFYGGGFSSLPMHRPLQLVDTFLATLAVVSMYSVTVTRVLFRFITRRLEAVDLALGLVAAFGLGTLLLYINRSHQFNLFHPIIPFCILAAFYGAERGAQVAGGVAAGRERNGQFVTRLRHGLPGILIALLAGALGINVNVRNYPSPLTALRDPPRTLADPTSARARRENALLSAAHLRAGIQPVVDELRRLSRAGEKVAVVSEDETLLLLLADVSPWFRYSPLEPLHNRQLEIIERQFRDQPPDVVLFLEFVQPEREAIGKRFRQILDERYVVEREMGDWQVFRRQSGSP